jgi:uncharacterized protein (TIGR03118 family)
MFGVTRTRPVAPFRTRPRLEALEDRWLPSANVLQTNLVSDLTGVATFQDPHLVNPWGIAASSAGPFWVADNGTGVSTLYNTAGMPLTLVVSIPAPGAPLGADGTPTGIVFNVAGGAAGGFKISGFTSTGAATSATASFLFATEDGTIVGWNPGVNPAGFNPAKAGTYGIIAVDNSGSDAVYKGLAIATGPSGPIFPSDANSATVLYAANFHSGQIEVYDKLFSRVTLSAGAFTDPNLPRDYAPFNVQVLGNKVYVTYAKQDADKVDEVAGPGKGFVDVYNLDGSGGQRLVSGGPLNAPWGLAIAPPSFGSLAGALLVGNFGDGHINAFNAATGAFLDELKDPDGEPIAIDGLWALQVGNGGNGGSADTVYFTAGLFDETHGLFGSLKPVAEGSPEGQAEAQMVTAAQDVFQIKLTELNTDLANGADRATLREDLHELQVAFRDLVRAEVRFAIDARRDAGGHGPGNGSFLKDLDGLFAGFGGLGKDRD